MTCRACSLRVPLALCALLSACSGSSEPPNEGGSGTAGGGSPGPADPTKAPGADPSGEAAVGPTGGGAPAAPAEPTPGATVCAGALGDGTGLKTVQWVLGPVVKYKVPLGTGLEENDLNREPSLFSSTFPRPNVSGAPSFDSGQSTHATAGVVSKSSFADGAAARTVNRDLGFSELASAVYALTTMTMGSAADASKAFMSNGHASRGWTLSRPALEPDPSAGPTAFYVRRVDAVFGVSWVFAVHFDAPCKRQGYESLVGENAWTPRTGVTREALQSFLATNKASFKIGIVQTGPVDVPLRTLLEKSACAPSDLDACDALASGIEARRRELFGTGVKAGDYAALVRDGHVGAWALGRVQAEPITSVP